MDHLYEVLKIIEGAVNADPKRVAAYAEQLAEKLEKDGNEKAAGRLRRAVTSSRAQKLNLARAGGTKKAAAGGQVPVDTESRVTLANEEELRPGAISVFLEPRVEQELGRFLRLLRGADKLVANGVGISPTLLLYGPPGCGKTEVGRYIAAELGLPLLTARTDGLISSFLGSTAKNVRRLFEHASSRPCVLFLDEFDAIAKLRDDQYEQGELKRVVVSLLQNIDALNNETIVIAATNHEHLLDPAVWRRFAFRLHLENPGRETREQLFQLFLGEHACEESTRLFSLASEGLTGADIRQLSEDGRREAVLENRDSVSSPELLRRILSISTPEALTESSGEVLRKAREVSPKVFTIRRLAEMFGLSVGKVHKELRKG